jgi:hypothetical protein
MQARRGLLVASRGSVGGLQSALPLLAVGFRNRNEHSTTRPTILKRRDRGALSRAGAAPPSRASHPGDLRLHTLLCQLVAGGLTKHLSAAQRPNCDASDPTEREASTQPAREPSVEPRVAHRRGHPGPQRHGPGTTLQSSVAKQASIWSGLATKPERAPMTPDRTDRRFGMRSSARTTI